MIVGELPIAAGGDRQSPTQAACFFSQAAVKIGRESVFNSSNDPEQQYPATLNLEAAESARSPRACGPRFYLELGFCKRELQIFH